MTDKKRFASLHYYGDEAKPPKQRSAYPFGIKLHDGVCLFGDFDRSLAEKWVRRLNASAKKWTKKTAANLSPRVRGFLDGRDGVYKP